MASFVGVQTVDVAVWPGPEQVVQDEHTVLGSGPVAKKPASQTHVISPVVGSVEAVESAGHCALAATSASTSAAARSAEEECCAEEERCAEEKRRAEEERCAVTRRSAAGFVMVCV